MNLSAAVTFRDFPALEGKPRPRFCWSDTRLFRILDLETTDSGEKEGRSNMEESLEQDDEGDSGTPFPGTAHIHSGRALCARDAAQINKACLGGAHTLAEGNRQIKQWLRGGERLEKRGKEE